MVIKQKSIMKLMCIIFGIMLVAENAVAAKLYIENYNIDDASCSVDFYSNEKPQPSKGIIGPRYQTLLDAYFRSAPDFSVAIPKKKKTAEMFSVENGAYEVVALRCGHYVEECKVAVKTTTAIMIEIDRPKLIKVHRADFHGRRPSEFSCKIEDYQMQK